MLISNPAVRNGRWLPADWDRRHQVTIQGRAQIRGRMSLFCNWYLATGIPNTLAFASESEPDRLGIYHRADVGFDHRSRFKSAVVELQFSAFNVYDRDNPWYRTHIGFIDGAGANRDVRFVGVDVYDIGFQPSFSVSVTM